MITRKIIPILMLIFLAIPTIQAETPKTIAFDHGAWNRLLVAHVLPINDGKNTVVDYQGMQEDRQALRQYLAALSAVSALQFNQWTKQDQLAFLINVYNAWTVELILTAWPDLVSIKDLGHFFRSPWQKKFVQLMGKTYTLDDIEHGMIRDAGRYQEPRIHFAVNCASIGCPALRAEAYVGDKLDQQLDEQSRLFLNDPDRNRVEAGVIKLSPIFKWYREDFEKGWQGFNRLEDFLLAYTDDARLSNTTVEKLKNGSADIEFLDYDWRLNKK